MAIKFKQKKDNISWECVEKYLKEKTDAGDIMALIETEKLFKQVVKSMELPGEDIERQIESMHYLFSDYKALKQTREVFEKAVEKINFAISREEIRRNLSNYYQGITELIEAKKNKLTATKKLFLYIKTFFPTPSDFIKKYLIVILLFFMVVFILDSTNVGHDIVDIFVKVSHIVFSWVLFIILFVAGIAILVVGSIYYFQGKKK